MNNFWIVMCLASRSDTQEYFRDEIGFTNEKDARQRVNEWKREFEDRYFEIQEIRPSPFVVFEPNSYLPCEEN